MVKAKPPRSNLDGIAALHKVLLRGAHQDRKNLIRRTRLERIVGKDAHPSYFEGLERREIHGLFPSNGDDEHLLRHGRPRVVDIKLAWAPNY